MERIEQHVDVGSSHVATQPVGVNSISPEEGGAVPKQIKIVTITYIMGSAGRLEHCVNTGDPAGVPCSMGHRWNRNLKKKDFPQLIKKLKRSL